MDITEARLKFPRAEFVDRHKGGGKLYVGKDVRIARGARLDLTADITIGSNVVICEDVKIFTHKHDKIKDYDFKSIEPIRILINGNVFISEGARIMATAGMIGEGSVIGPLAVVETPVPAGALMKGNPAHNWHGEVSVNDPKPGNCTCLDPKNCPMCNPKLGVSSHMVDGKICDDPKCTLCR